MQHSIGIQLEELSRLRHAAPSTVIAEALEIGMTELYRETVLKRYLNKHLSRNKAIELVGRDWVELTDRQHRIVQKDIAWGLGLG